MPEAATNQGWTKYLPAFLRGKLEKSQLLQRVIHNTGWLFFDKALRMGVGFLITVWVTRYLGPERYGLLSYASAFVGLFTAIANIGLYGIVVRDVVRHPESTDEILGTAMLLKFCGGVLALLLSMGAILILQPGQSLTHWLVGITAAGFIFQSFEVFDFWFQSQLLSKRAISANLVGFVLITIAKIVLILIKAPLIAFAWAGTLEVLVGSFGLLVAYQMVTKRMSYLRISLDWAKRLLRDSWPLIFAGLMLMIYNRIDQVMLGQMLGDRSVGIYSVAVKLSEFWYVFPALILNSILPTIVEAKAAGEDFYYRRLQRVFDLMAMVSLGFVLPLFLFSDQIIRLLYGKAYLQAGGVLAIYVLSGVFVFIGHVREYWVTVENFTRYSLYSTGVGAGINVVLNLILIPRFGNIGAAWATLIALFTGSYFINAWHPKTRSIFVMQTKALLLISPMRRLLKQQ
ncbi:flippase [Geomesophilobacter sediminis]|uniref:Flippase n=1 Tax=Geomesophilobacter sediminis TaxID=2798584 RepID=A0A8J7S9Q9_9BACT|nr:flippase [Geomesophilobacter sediminis]MBJ6727026.1 flippase [Geomesophilobacter sediminis]